ncbi:MAG: monovalent cation/H+ antiporter subunit D family protein [Rhodobiaceae bacterium]|nr:monovalent cation/H+ antiporter subunit D family protein [Rhodobiaceae bacterium]MCC0042258.1 monovalent cation/H+ antiporter subunit D family protein [Rhodobiaceae bacterium]
MIGSLFPGGDNVMLLALCVPVIAAILIPLFGARPNLRETVTLVSAGVLFDLVVILGDKVLRGDLPSLPGLQVLPGLEIRFAIEPLGMIFALVASTLWIVNSIYSIGYMRGNNEPRQTPFYICFAVAIFATLGIAFSANLFTLFLFYEVLTLSTYPLVTHKGNDDARKAGRIYLVLLLATSMLLLLPAIIWTGVVAGTLDFASGGILAGKVSPALMGVLLFLFVYGIGKAAVMPVHFWLPAAMVAPTPVSALLHAVAVVKAGVFSVVKVIVYVFGVDALREAGTGDWLAYVAGFTVIAASIVALRQDNLKKRLAFSTISQLSYVVLAAAILTPISLVGAAMHIAAHAVSKITLFFAAGSIYTAAHLTEISQLKGIGRRMPWTMTAFAIGALSMIGVPPTAGFLGKWFMLTGAMETKQWVPVGVIMLSTILNATYFLPIIFDAFFKAPPEPEPGHHAHGEAPWPIVLALTATAAGTILLFFFPAIPLALAEMMMGMR